MGTLTKSPLPCQNASPCHKDFRLQTDIIFVTAENILTWNKTQAYRSPCCLSQDNPPKMFMQKDPLTVCPILSLQMSVVPWHSHGVDEQVSLQVSHSTLLQSQSWPFLNSVWMLWLWLHNSTAWRYQAPDGQLSHINCPAWQFASHFVLATYLRWASEPASSKHQQPLRISWTHQTHLGLSWTSRNSILPHTNLPSPTMAPQSKSRALNKHCRN